MSSKSRKSQKSKKVQKTKQTEYEAVLKAEKSKEQDPLYLAIKERLGIEAQNQTNAYYNHPCQNDNNTFTYLSSDKAHEIDVEIDQNNKTCQLNIINADPRKRHTFVNLLLSVQSVLNREKITKVYQSVTLSDWEHIKKHFVLDKIVQNPLNPFVICHSDIKTFVSAISQSMGMNVNSHLDKVTK